MNARHRNYGRLGSRKSFTLTELMTVVMIIGILASTLLFAMYAATQEARVARTRAQIAKIHQLLSSRWDSYRTRPIRLSLPRGASPVVVARARLDALRELMRLELPDCKSDVIDNPVLLTGNVTITRPAISQQYLRIASAAGSWTNLAHVDPYEDSECLYMILASMHDSSSNALDFFQEGEITDLDNNGMPEISDAWGKPLAFLRWPAGFLEHPGADSTFNTADDIPSYTILQRADPVGSPDPYDPLKVDPRFTGSAVPIGSGPATYQFNFAIFPLVCSAGPDGAFDIVRWDYDPNDVNKSAKPSNYYRGSTDPTTQPKNDPYTVLPTCKRRLGEPFLTSQGYIDNITNHFMEAK